VIVDDEESQLETTTQYEETIRLELVNDNDEGKHVGVYATMKRLEVDDTNDNDKHIKLYRIGNYKHFTQGWQWTMKKSLRILWRNCVIGLEVL